MIEFILIVIALMALMGSVATMSYLRGISDAGEEIAKEIDRSFCESDMKKQDPFDPLLQDLSVISGSVSSDDKEPNHLRHEILLIASELAFSLNRAPPFSWIGSVPLSPSQSGHVIAIQSRGDA